MRLSILIKKSNCKHNRWECLNNANSMLQMQTQIFRRTTRKAMIAIASTYIISAILWPPWIVLWPYIEGKSIAADTGQCVVQFLAIGDSSGNLRNQIATLATSIAAFYLPVTIMAILYYRIYSETKKRRREFQKLQAGQLFTSNYDTGISALQSLMLPLVPLVRGFQSSSTRLTSPIHSTNNSFYSHQIVTSTTPGSSHSNINPWPRSTTTSNSGTAKIARKILKNSSSSPALLKTNLSPPGNIFLDFLNSTFAKGRQQSQQSNGPIKSTKKDKFTLLKFCTGKAGIATEDEIGSSIDEYSRDNVETTIEENSWTDRMTMHSSRGTSLNKSSTTNYRNSKEHKSIQAASRENFKDEENVANSDEIFFHAHRDDFTAISTSFKRRAQKEDIALIVSSISKTDHETITNNGMRQLELNNDARVITPSIFYYTYTLLIEYLENDREKRPSIRLASPKEVLEIERTIEERNVKHQNSLPINGARLSASTDRPMLFNCSSESPSIIEIANEFDGIEADNKISDEYEKYQSTEVRPHVQAHKLILPELSISNTNVRVPQGEEKSDARKSETIDIPSHTGEQHRLPKPYSMRRLNALLTKSTNDPSTPPSPNFSYSKSSRASSRAAIMGKEIFRGGMNRKKSAALRKAMDINTLREEHMRKSEKERRKNEKKQETKAAKTLSAILCAFIITWTPYFIIVCFESFYPQSIPGYLFTISYFLCYVNSTINPFCYALCNSRFRRTFLRILYCKWTSRGHKNKLTMIGAESQKSATGGTLPPLPLNKAALVRNAYQAGKLIGKN